MPLISEESRKWLPNFENPNNVLVDDDWWAEHFEPVSHRFKEWIVL